MTSSPLEILAVRVHGLPVAQPRVKTRLWKNPAAPLGVSTAHFEPAHAKDWKRTVMAQVIPVKPSAPVEGPLGVELGFVLPRPISLPKRQQYPVRKPDVENLSKAVLDALEGIVYRNDAQIVRLSVSKDYGPAPGVSIRVVWLGAEHVSPAAMQDSLLEDGRAR